MNTQVNSATSFSSTDLIATTEGREIQLPAGAGLALAVVLGSVMWLGIFALIM